MRYAWHYALIYMMQSYRFLRNLPSLACILCGFCGYEEKAARGHAHVVSQKGMLPCDAPSFSLFFMAKVLVPERYLCGNLEWGVL